MSWKEIVPITLASILSIISFFLATAAMIMATPKGKILAFMIFVLPFILLMYFKKLRIPIIIGAFIGIGAFIAFFLFFIIIGSVAPGL
ncbi:MAG: hypothetical protein J7J82_02255 [Staphylothermus sp.]|nr:hypothetical protein [Staphylothermus sp.]